jgi:hypothetical protein
MYKDDRKRIVFLYTWLLSIFLLTPFLLLIIIQGNMYGSRVSLLSEVINQEVIVTDNQIIDGLLISSEPFETTFDYFLITNEATVSSFFMVVYFNESTLELQIAGNTFYSKTYEALDLINLNLMDESSASYLVVAISKLINESTLITFTDVTAQWFAIIIDFLAVTLILTWMMTIGLKRGMYTFSERFKVGIYLSSIYVIMQFILITFQLGNLSFLSAFVTYVWYFRAYQPIRMRGR